MGDNVHVTNAALTMQEVQYTMITVMIVMTMMMVMMMMMIGGFVQVREKGQDWRPSVERFTGDYDDDDDHYYNDFNDDLIMTMFHRLSQVCYPSLLVTPQHWSRVPHARFDYFLRCESVRGKLQQIPFSKLSQAIPYTWVDCLKLYHLWED